MSGLFENPEPIICLPTYEARRILELKLFLPIRQDYAALRLSLMAANRFAI